MTATWRSVSTSFVEIGRELKTIEGALTNIRATAIIPDDKAIEQVNNALRAARRLVHHLSNLQLEVEEK